jgi:hypothetical protein
VKLVFWSIERRHDLIILKLQDYSIGCAGRVRILVTYLSNLAGWHFLLVFSQLSW